MSEATPPQCPHCGQVMKKNGGYRSNPPGRTNTSTSVFNDDCPYFVQGWEQIWQAQNVRASYRCRLDPRQL